MTKGKGRTPGFGGLDKHIKRSAHRERAQPRSREHLGALEKHKDYQKRSKRRHERESKLKQAKRAAALRNPDEFNMKMTEFVMDLSTGKMKRLPKKTPKEELREEALRNVKNKQYLEHKARSDTKAAKELAVELAGATTKPRCSHLIFVEGGDDEVQSFDAARYFDTAPSLLPFPSIRAKTSFLEQLPQEDDDDGAEEEEGANKDGTAEADGAADEPSQKRKPLDMSKHQIAMTAREIVERSRRAKRLSRICRRIDVRNDALKKELLGKKVTRFSRGAVVRAR